MIPHNFGMAKMSNFIINDKDKVKQKLDLIDNLIDINVAVNDEEESEPSTQASTLLPNPLD